MSREKASGGASPERNRRVAVGPWRRRAGPVPGEDPGARWQRLCVLAEMGIGEGASEALDAVLDQVADDLDEERRRPRANGARGLLAPAGADLSRMLGEALATSERDGLAARRLLREVHDELGLAAAALLDAVHLDGDGGASGLRWWLNQHEPPYQEPLLLAARLRAVLRRAAEGDQAAT